MKWHQDNDSTQWKFSQSLSSSKQIILSVVTYKLYLQQKKKPQRKFWIWKPGFNMLTAHLPVKKTSYRKLPIKTPPIRGAVLFNTET